MRHRHRQPCRLADLQRPKGQGLNDHAPTLAGLQVGASTIPRGGGLFVQNPILSAPIQQRAAVKVGSDLHDAPDQNRMRAEVDHIFNRAIKGQGRIGQQAHARGGGDPVCSLIVRGALHPTLARKPLCHGLIGSAKGLPAKHPLAPQKRPARRGAVDAGQDHRRSGR